MSTTWIAEQHVIFVHPGGHRRPVRIAVGAPEVVSPIEGRCLVVLDGMQPEVPILGASPLQALMAAVRYLEKWLGEFITSGGRVLDETGSDDLYGPPP